MKKYKIFGIDEEQIPIGGYISPTPQSEKYPEKESLITESVYKKVKESGINFLIAFYESLQTHPKEFMESLRLAEKYGLQLMIRDDNFYAYRPYQEALFVQSLKTYKDSPAFSGIHVCDEPGSKKFDLLKQMQESMQRNCPGKTCYVNLFPHFATPKQLVSDLSAGDENPDYDYERYLRDYIRIVKPSYISFDYYPLTEKEGKIYPAYYNQINMIREASKEAKIPFWCFVQTTNWWPPFRTPVFSEILFQVCTCLAFGARGIQYFPFCTPNGETGNEIFHSAVLDLDGNRTSVFAAVQYANEHIRAVSRVLMTFEHIGMLFAGELPAELPDSCVIALPDFVVGFSGKHTLAGVFERGNELAMYAVNSDMFEEEELEIKFSSKRNMAVILGNQKLYFNSESIKLRIEAGRGVLLEFFQR